MDNSNEQEPSENSSSEDNEDPPTAEQSQIAEDAALDIDDAVKGVPPIPYHLVEKHYNKTTKLLSNSGIDEKIQAKNRWHDYEFTKPLFLAFVDISGENLSDSDEYLCRVVLEDGTQKHFSARPIAGVVRVDVNEFCQSFSFKPPSVYWSLFRRTPELQKVSLWGFYKENLGDFLYNISRVTKLKNEAVSKIEAIRDEASEKLAALVTKENELSDINQSISDANSNLENLNTSIAEKEATDSELQSKITRSENQLETIDDQVSQRKAELDTITKSREHERQEVDKAKAELKKLTSNVNLFPSEISGFVDQASNDIQTYKNFSVGLIAIICVLFVWVLSGAFDLSEFVKQNPEREIWPLLLAKLPLAIAVSALVAAAYKISRVFIGEILRINQQKLSLTQVSIIAKDVSQAAEHDLELSETQTYGLRLRAKMAMLSDHIGTFVPTNAKHLFPQSIFDTISNESDDSTEQAEGEIPTLILPDEDSPTETTDSDSENNQSARGDQG